MTSPPSVDSASSGRQASREVATLRREIAVLGGLRDDDAARLLQVGRRFDSLPDEVVFDVGAGCDHVYLLLDGVVSLTATPRGRLDGAIELRRVSRGEAFGLEAAFGARVRHARATCVGRAELIELPADLFARGVRRAGTRAASDLERAVRRRLTDERLRTLAFTSALPEPERALLLDMVRARRVDAGGVVYRQSQTADAMVLLVSGMVRLVSVEGTRRRVRAYLSAGDFFGEHETLSSGTYRLTAEAMSACELLVVGRDELRTLVRRNPGLLEAMQRIGFDRQQSQQDAFAAVRPDDGTDDTGLGHTRHLFEDVYRASVATELLAIDLDQCVHCGTCAWSCHETHGQARLVRRGDKVLAPSVDGGDAPRRLLLPNSCQHCTDPACMVDCPTGAIGRDPDGEVFIHEATCIGCEACAKACPWDNIQIAPAAPGSLHSQVAVKCDLCRGHDGVSACVSNCPTGAIVRLDPRQESAALRQVLGLATAADAAPAARPPTARRLPLQVGVLAAVVLACVAGLVGTARGALVPFAGAGLAAGVVACVGMLGLASYGVRKRAIGWLMRGRRRKVARGGSAGPMAKLSTWYQAHLALGAVTLGAVLLHTGGRPGGALTAALLGALLGATALGVIGLWLYRRLPARIARLVARPGLPEDTAETVAHLRRSMREALSGRAGAKARAAAALTPALASRWTPWRLLLSSDEDRHALRDRMLAEAGADTLDGAERHALDRAARYCVELLGLGAERLGQRLLGGWLLAHLVFSLVALVLMVVHAVSGALLVWQG